MHSSLYKVCGRLTPHFCVLHAYICTRVVPLMEGQLLSFPLAELRKPLEVKQPSHLTSRSLNPALLKSHDLSNLTCTVIHVLTARLYTSTRLPHTYGRYLPVDCTQTTRGQYC